MNVVERIVVKRVQDDRGKLAVWDGLPFNAVRMFQITGVRAGASRGNHAHRTCEQAVVCTNGSFVLNTTTPDGKADTHVLLDGDALYIPPMHWILLNNFSPHAVCTVLASEPYTTPISDFEEFKAA